MQWQIPIQRSGLAEGYTIQHCTVQLDLTSNQDLPLQVWSLKATNTLHSLLLYQPPQGIGTVKQTQQSYFGVCWFTVKPRYEPLQEGKSKYGWFKVQILYKLKSHDPVPQATVHLNFVHGLHSSVNLLHHPLI
jgi:hypothetical protein